MDNPSLIIWISSKDSKLFSTLGKPFDTGGVESSPSMIAVLDSVFFGWARLKSRCIPVWATRFMTLAEKM